MIRTIFYVLCFSALISAGVIKTEYTPTSSVSYSSISTPNFKTLSTPVVEKSYNGPTAYSKIIQSSPVYQSVLTTKESSYESPDGLQHTAYTKSLDTAYSSLKKYESKSTKDSDVLANTIPGIYSTAAQSPIIYHHGAAYTVSSPLVQTVHSPVLSKSVPVPVAYTTHDTPLSKTIVSPPLASYSAPVFDQTKYVVSGLSSYSTHTPVLETHPIKTTITYSEAPLVSHMSFSGLGASYAW